MDCKFLTRHSPAIATEGGQGRGGAIEQGEGRGRGRGEIEEGKREKVKVKRKIQDFSPNPITLYPLSQPHSPQPTLLQLFISGNPFSGNGGSIQVPQDWFKKLLTTGELQALVIYGSPYVKNQFLSVLPSNIPCVFSYGQIPAAQAIAPEALFTKFYN